MNILGTWLLDSCVGRSQSGKAFLPYGANPVGQLIYGQDGRMSVFLMNSNRSRFQSHDLTKAGSDEKVAAFDSFDSYAGTYLIDPSAGTVAHRIEMARVPNWIGIDHLRRVRVEEQTLTLITEPFDMSGELWEVEVVWRRACV